MPDWKCGGIKAATRDTKGETSYSCGFWPNVWGRGNLRGKLQNVGGTSPFVKDLYSK